MAVGERTRAETAQGSHAPILSGIDSTRVGTALAQGLGWFSIGMGLSELVWTGPARAAGLERASLRRLAGAGEIAGGVAILLAARRLARPEPRMFRAIKSVAINRAPDECYLFWRNLSNLACFMEAVECVTALDERRSCWVAKGPGGRRVEWEAEITRDEPGHMIGWRSLPGGDLETEGTVLFQPRPGDRGTMVRVAMEWRPPAGAVGEALARLFMASPAQQLKEDLRRMKALLETGEVPTTEGQPAGRRGTGHRALTRWLTGGAA